MLTDTFTSGQLRSPVRLRRHRHRRMSPRRSQDRRRLVQHDFRFLPHHRVSRHVLNDYLGKEVEG